MTNLTSPDCRKPVWWHVPYHAALFETDLTKVSERITEAEKEILARVKELIAVTFDHIEDEHGLDDALYAVRALRSFVATPSEHSLALPLRLEPGEGLSSDSFLSEGSTESCVQPCIVAAERWS